MNNIILQCRNLYKSYQEGNIQRHILNNINFVMSKNETVAIIGRSGSGKSTLLHLLSGLDTPTSGEVIFLDKPMSKISSNEKAKIRNNKIGFIHQFYHLLPDFTVLENISMPLFIGKKNYSEIKILTNEMLKLLELWNIRGYYPPELSGGERQRVAIARALINNPQLVLADEPTGNLDTYNTDIVFCLLNKMNKMKGVALLVVTHDLGLAKRMNRHLTIKDGELLEIKLT